MRRDLERGGGNAIALQFYSRMIFSENRWPLFRIMR